MGTAAISAIRPAPLYVSAVQAFVPQRLLCWQTTCSASSLKFIASIYIGDGQQWVWQPSKTTLRSICNKSNQARCHTDGHTHAASMTALGITVPICGEVAVGEPLGAVKMVHVQSPSPKEQ